MSKNIFIIYFILSFLALPMSLAQAQTTPASQVEPLKDKELKAIKGSDPKRYQKILREKDVLMNIRRITTAYRKKELSAGQARQALYPLIEEHLKDRPDNTADEIARLEKKLEVLKKSQSDSLTMIEKEIDTLLGIGTEMPLKEAAGKR